MTVGPGAQVDIKRAAMEEPTREVVARALEHVQVPYFPISSLPMY